MTPSHRLLPALLAGVALALTTPASAVTPSAVTHRAAAPGATGSVPGQPGLPLGAPPAATGPEPTLPEPSRAAWPFPSSFPRTSGTGRLAGGAALWTDFVYDDHGPSSLLGLPTGSSSNTSNLAATQGVYSYPAGSAKGNGADVFRSAVAADSTSSYWRVDWNTLADPTVPLAEWTIDTDNNTTSGVAAWPAAAGVSSPGIDRALVVSNRSARLIDTRTGRATDVVAAGGALTVDGAARSFVVRIPNSLLPVTGTWRVRLGAGLSDATGTAFAMPPSSPSTSTERLYNVSYRSGAQEPQVYTDGMTVALVALAQKTLAAPVLDAYGPDGPVRSITGNFWNEDHQADALATGDVSDFSQVLDTQALVNRASTPEPQPTGYSIRWYVSRLALGQGVIANPMSAGTGDLRPNYLGRVQPYSVYVPTGYRSTSPAPLTWLLHSLGVNHNQYAALDPRLLQQLCQDRHSICASTLGFGPDGWYFDEAEVDFWQVWHAMAASYALDPEKTVISGYSMGGWATYKLGLAHPDLFAGALTLEGPNRCGVRVVKGVDLPADGTSPGRCGSDGESAPLLKNARWLPYDITQGAIDQLVPATGTLQQVQDLDTLGYRYHFTFYAGEDHLFYATQDRFGAPVAALGMPRRTVDPGHVTYTWYPHLSRADFGIGTTTAYWLGDLVARTRTPGTLATVDATASTIPDPAITAVRSGPTAINDPTPGLVSTLAYRYGATPAAQPVLSLRLSDVRSLSLDTVRSRFTCGTIRTTSDGPATLALRGLPAGATVSSGGRSRSAGAVAVPAGSGTITVSCASTATKPGPDGSARPVSASPATAATDSLASTGGDGWPMAALALLGLGLLVRRRTAPGR